MGGNRERNNFLGDVYFPAQRRFNGFLDDELTFRCVRDRNVTYLSSAGVCNLSFNSHIGFPSQNTFHSRGTALVLGIANAVIGWSNFNLAEPSEAIGCGFMDHPRESS